MARPKKQTEEIKKETIEEVKIETTESPIVGGGDVASLLKAQEERLHTHCYACNKPLVGFVVGGGKKFCNDNCLLTEYPNAFGPR